MSVRPGTYSSLSVEYSANEDSERARISLIIMSYSMQHKSWDRFVIWELDLHSLKNDMIQSEDLDNLYFLSNPILGSSLDSKTIAFVFLETLFFLDYSDDIASYTLEMNSLVKYMGGSDFDVDFIYISNDGDIVVLVSEVRY